jgi:hypothetical protein
VAAAALRQIAPLCGCIRRQQQPQPQRTGHQVQWGSQARCRCFCPRHTRPGTQVWLVFGLFRIDCVASCCSDRSVHTISCPAAAFHVECCSTASLWHAFCTGLCSTVLRATAALCCSSCPVQFCVRAVDWGNERQVGPL